MAFGLQEVATWLLVLFTFSKLLSYADSLNSRVVSKISAKSSLFDGALALAWGGALMHNL